MSYKVPYWVQVTTGQPPEMTVSVRRIRSPSAPSIFSVVRRSPKLTNESMGSLEATVFVARTRMDKRKRAVVDETLDRAQPEAGRVGLPSQARANLKV